MYCRNCGKEVDEKAEICPSCGFKPLSETKYCQNCGKETQAKQEVCTNCGVKLESIIASGSGQVGSKNKLTAGLLAIFLGSLGIHKFYLGYSVSGVIMLLVTIIGGIVTLGVASAVMGVIALIEGIMYLTKDDNEFYEIYEKGKKSWF